MVILLGWACTATVLLGFYLNAIRKYHIALITWIIGDLGWIVYDYLINNWSHATLSTLIIVINLYGYINLRGRIMSNRKISKISKDLLS